jgi:hypothetical protein
MDCQRRTHFFYPETKALQPLMACGSFVGLQSAAYFVQVAVQPNSKDVYAIVTSDYPAIEKCLSALGQLPTLQSEPETIARPRRFDRLTILSPLTRAEDGEDIYKVRTAQGWEGWINSKFVDIQQ